MNPLGNRTEFKSFQQQETVQPETGERKFIVKLKVGTESLKATKAKLQEKKAELDQIEQNAEMQMSKLLQNNLLQSQAGTSQLSDSHLFFSHIDPNEIEQQDVLAEAQYQALAENQNIEQQEEAIDIEIMKNQEELTHSEEVTLWDHAAEILVREGTTLVTALATLGVGVSTAVTAPNIIGITVAIATAGIVGNETKKFILRHLSDTGSKEHSKVIKQALENAEAKTKQADAAIDMIIKDLDDCTTNIANADKILENLTEQLKGKTGELKQHIEDLTKLHTNVKNTQEKKKAYLLEAYQNSEEACKILRGQEKLLRDLQKMETPQSFTEDSLKQLLLEIKAKIAHIKAEGEKAHDATLKSLHIMGTVLQINDTSIYDEINQLTAHVALVIDKLEQATSDALQAKKETTEAMEKAAAAKEETAIAKDAIQDIKIDLEIAGRANELREQEFQLGGGSMLYGMGAGGVMTIGSAMLLGPASLAFMSIATVGTFASATVAHYIRAAKRANAHLAQKKQMEIGTAALTNTQSKKSINSFGINATYTEGTGVLKSISNTALSWMGKSQYLSSHQGVITLRLGSETTLEDETFELMESSRTFDFIFDKTHEDAIKIGAMTAEQQGKLSAYLTKLLNNNLLTPQKILEILNSFKNVNVSGVNVVMIKENSIHMKKLIKKCHLMIQKK